jgi:hypothetical protein
VARSIFLPGDNFLKRADSLQPDFLQSRQYQHPAIEIVAELGAAVEVLGLILNGGQAAVPTIVATG